jgi:hypothetical protein
MSSLIASSAVTLPGTKPYLRMAGAWADQRFFFAAARRYSHLNPLVTIDQVTGLACQGVFKSSLTAHLLSEPEGLPDTETQANPHDHFRCVEGVLPN